MEFIGPEPGDMKDVHSLNAVFLVYLGSDDGRSLRQELPGSLQPAIAAISGRQIDRLASVPFLIPSLSESDETYWDPVTDDLPVADLFQSRPAEPGMLARIASAALGFVWQLARKNPYAARLVCGASVRWCEQLAACTLLHVLERAARDPCFIKPRMARDEVFWQWLLGPGLSSEPQVRRAARLCSMQAILKPDILRPPGRFRSAACQSSVPSLEFREPDTPGEG